MRGKTLIYVLVGLWLIIFAGSIVMSFRIEGPRNIDTGLARLDMLVRGQLVALALAIIAGVTGFFVRGGGLAQRLIGLAPLALTMVLVAGLFGFASLQIGNEAAPEPVRSPRSSVTEPAPALPAGN